MLAQSMYSPQKDSPTTFLSGDILATDTVIYVAATSALPQVAPYPLTLGVDKTITETVIVTSINDEYSLSVTRGTPALAWPANTKLARVLNAADISAIQENIRGLNEQTDGISGTISSQATTIQGLSASVHDPETGLVKLLANEVANRISEVDTEKTRATSAENLLDSIKINRTELPQILISISSSPLDTSFLLLLDRYNASNKTSSSYYIDLPLVTPEHTGIMTPEAYNEIISLRNDVYSLQQQGGKYIGINFATKAALNAYVIPDSVKLSDFTYVLDDESQNGATTRYIYNGTIFAFAFVVESDPIALANTEIAGVVKSTSGVNGRIFVEPDGAMSLFGYDALLLSIAGKAAATHNHNAANINAGIFATARLPAASTSAQGAVVLDTSINSESTTTAATPSAVKEAYDLANSKAAAAHSHNASSITGGVFAAARLPAASTSVQGAVILENTTNSSSTTTAATANAVKTAYDKANSKADASHNHDASNITGGTFAAARLPAASTSVQGAVTLSNLYDSESKVTAASSYAVKQVYDRLNSISIIDYARKIRNGGI